MSVDVLFWRGRAVVDVDDIIFDSLRVREGGGTV